MRALAAIALLSSLEAYVPLNVQKRAAVAHHVNTARELPVSVGRMNVDGPSKLDRGSLFGPLKSAKSLSIALDRSVVPRGALGGYMGQLFVFGVFVRQFLKFREKRNLARVGEYDDDDVYDDSDDEYYEDSDSYVKGLLPSLIEKVSEKVGTLASKVLNVVKVPFVSTALFVALCLKVVAAKLFYTYETAVSFVNDFIEFDPADIMNIKDWRICVLDERELLDGGIVRYRFELPNDNAVLPLTVGQELVMCAVDARDKVLKSSFYPVSKSSERGFFEVLVDRAHSSVEASNFNRNLDTLALGDEIAFKGGRQRLNYMGIEPIYGISVAASHLGIAPAIQLLRGVLGDRRSAVEDTELLWLNEDEEDFVCEDDVEGLEYRHIEKLAVSRIVEEDLYAAAYAKSEAIQEAIAPYDEGRLGVICAPDYIVPGLRKLFQDLGYPADNIITVPIA